jgi:uncharacterized membrane protein YfhO
MPSILWTNTSYSVIALIAVVFLFAEKDRYAQLKIGFTLLTVMLIFPIFGYIMNAFSYVSNRWIWGYSFLVALISAIMIPSILKASKKQLLYLTLFIPLYMILCLNMKNSNTKSYLESMIVFMWAALFIICYNTSRDKIHSFIKGLLNTIKINTKLIALPDFTSGLFKTGMLVLIIFSIIINAKNLYSSNGANYTSEFRDQMVSYNIIMDTSAQAVNELGDKSFYRYNENNYGGQSSILNSALINQQNGTNFYFGVLDKNIAQFRKELDLDPATQNFSFRGVDNQAISEILLNVKYFVVKKGLEQYLSYGFNQKVFSYEDLSKNMYDIYTNENVLPLGYTYSSYMPRLQYEMLSVNQKQQALLQTAVVDSESSFNVEDLQLANPSYQDQKLNYSIECKSGVSYDGHKFIVEKASAQIDILFEGIPNTETYLNIENLWFETVRPISRYSENQWQNLPNYERNKLIEQDKYWSSPQTLNIKSDSGKVSKTQSYATPNHIYYTNKHNYLFNMGYSEEPKNLITLSFSQPGDYTFDSLNIICQPLAYLSEQVNELKEDILNNVVISDNLVIGNISLDKTKILCLAIPYNGGWTAYVNGKPAELLRVNTMYSGLILESGKYDIELKYFTPGLKSGLICFATGILILVVIEIILRKKQMKPGYRK